MVLWLILKVIATYGVPFPIMTTPCATQCAWYNVAYDDKSGVNYVKCKDTVIGKLVESEVNDD